MVIWLSQTVLPVMEDADDEQELSVKGSLSKQNPHENKVTRRAGDCMESQITCMECGVSDCLIW